MNLFRSEEHARRWPGFEPAMQSSLHSVAEWADTFSNPYFRERGRSDYISWAQGEGGQAARAELYGRLPRPIE